jgi:hypothetical protein
LRSPPVAELPVSVSLVSASELLVLASVLPASVLESLALVSLV